MNPCEMNSMWAWYLADPSMPVRVGTVTLAPSRTKCSFEYDKDWIDRGFALSPDMPTVSRHPIIGPKEFAAPGAIDDAMPDRWGQNTIRIIDRPSRLSPLDFLYFAGDRRFGALGISSDRETYRPYPNNPILTSNSLEEANEIIQRVIDKQPLNERERNLLRTSKNMGGAHPKMLVSIDGEEWLAKFPKGDVVDLPLVEHASNILAGLCGICTPESRSHRISIGHIVLTKRFDRNSQNRVHALSARTMLAQEGAESYSTLAGVIRKVSDKESIRNQQRELFARMAFNILMDNTDDHTKNHAFLRLPTGHYELAPAYDILPQMNGLGKQAIPVSMGALEDDFATAIANHAKFGMDADEAVNTWRNIADQVSTWKEVFAGLGVTGGDIDHLKDFLDSDDKLMMRNDSMIDTLPRRR